MKKTRNTFFEGYGYNNMGAAPMMVPNQGVSANSNFYAGPMPTNQNMVADIDSRISKLERQINRLETRVNTLEGNTSTTIDETTYTNSMYMV